MTEYSHVAVTRGGHRESLHRAHVAVVGADGELHWSAGDTGLLTFARSAVKPVQALPLIEDGAAHALGFGSRELALCCASHSGEEMHVALAASMLERIGATEADLACGAHEPFDRDSAAALRAAGQEPGRLHNNCSGKHAGMMALARHHGWPLQGYHELAHPVQQRMASAMSQWSGVPATELATGVDGCGVVTFGMPLHALARVFARLAQAGEDAPAATVVDSMLLHPDLVAGTKRMCTALMQASSSKIFAKVGAEGVYCAGVPSAGIGVALKIEDGAQRAAEPALLSVLQQLGFLSDAAMASLGKWARAEVRNTRGESVGGLETRIDLRRAR